MSEPRKLPRMPKAPKEKKEKDVYETMLAGWGCRADKSEHSRVNQILTWPTFTVKCESVWPAFSVKERPRRSLAGVRLPPSFAKRLQAAWEEWEACQKMLMTLGKEQGYSKLTEHAEHFDRRYDD